MPAPPVRCRDCPEPAIVGYWGHGLQFCWTHWHQEMKREEKSVRIPEPEPKAPRDLFNLGKEA